MSKSQETINSTLETAIKQLSIDLQEVRGHVLETKDQTIKTNGRMNIAEADIKLIRSEIVSNQKMADLKQKERDRMWGISLLGSNIAIGLAMYIIYNL